MIDNICILYIQHHFNARYMAGGIVNGKYSSDILVYDGNEDKWTKVGDLCHARAWHAMSLVPVESDIEDDCIVDQDCFF